MSEEKLNLPDPEYADVQAGIVELLRAARAVSARSVNAIMTATYWEIGRRIVESEMRGEKRADYGEQLVERLAVDLTRQFGRGFGRANLWQLRGLYRAWPDQEILQTPSGESVVPSLSSERPRFMDVPSLASRFPLPWSAYVRLLSVKNQDARNFYESETLRAGWSVRQLDRQIGSQFYERLALSRNKVAMLEKAEKPEQADRIKPEEAIKDPFVLEFLNLKDEYSESELEEALIQHLAGFPSRTWR